MIHPIIDVVKKELTDGVRDRRSMMSVIAFALFVPLFMAMMFGLIAQQRDDAPGELVVENASLAPGLVGHLRAAGYDVAKAEGELEAGVRDGDIRLALRIDPSFGEAMHRGKAARVYLLVDESRNRQAADRLAGTINTYGSELAHLRLQLRGLAPELAHPVDLVRWDYSTPAERAATLLGLLLFFLLMAPFAASMSLAIDMMAGERERRSIELLLVQPVALWRLLVGKWFAATIVAVIGVTLILVVSGQVLPTVDLSDIGINLNLPAGQLFMLGLVIAPLAFLAAALQLMLSLFARSYKEAQFYLSGLMFLPMMVVFGLDYLGIEDGTWQGVTPLVAQHELAMDVLRETPVSVSDFTAATFSTLLLAMIVIGLAGRLLGRERAVLA